MTLSILTTALLAAVSLAACDTRTSGGFVRFQSDSVVADRNLFIEAATDFYQDHPDDFDMLVFWGAPEFGPGHSYYLPVKNDVPGIGYRNEGEEFFDESAEFGSNRLQGIIWMGPDWITNAEIAPGPRSVLGILAQETGHRWGATIHFMDSTAQAESEALLEDGLHWNDYLNTGASPMGGNQWESLGDSLFRAVPVDQVEFSQLDLYLMGLLAAESVDPVQLLVNVRSAGESTGTEIFALTRRVSEPMTVEADLMEVSIDQIIEVEGLREPEVGFNAGNIRQGWIYVYQNLTDSSASELGRIETLEDQWGDFFNQATGGLSSMDTSLF